jgi:hypothetical protein
VHCLSRLIGDVQIHLKTLTIGALFSASSDLSQSKNLDVELAREALS